MGRSLVLNVTDQPLAVVPARRAVVLVLKEKALVRTKPSGVKPGRYRPPDSLLAFLEAL